MNSMALRSPLGCAVTCVRCGMEIYREAGAWPPSEEFVARARAALDGHDVRCAAVPAGPVACGSERP